MADFFKSLFTGSAGDTSRYNLWGVALLAAGVLVNAFARRLSEKTGKVPEPLIRIAGLLLGIVGALIAMKWIG